MADNRVEEREPEQNSQHDLNDNLINQALALTEDRSNRTDASSKPGSSSQLPPGLDNFCISMMPKENAGSSNLPKLSIDEPQLPEQKPGEQPLDRPTGPQPGAPELWDKPAQTEFDTIGGAAGNSSDTSVHPTAEQVAAPGEKALADDTPVGGSAKGGQEYQLCAAENPGGSGLPLERVNQANDAATATNIATAGRRANNPFFNPSSGALGLVTDFDVSPLTVAGWVSDA